MGKKVFTDESLSTFISEIKSYTDDAVSKTITVDSALSSTSENPVQNKVIQAALDALRQEISTSSGVSSGTYFKSASFSTEATGLDVDAVGSGGVVKDTVTVASGFTGEKIRPASTKAKVKLTKITYYLDVLGTRDGDVAVYANNSLLGYHVPSEGLNTLNFGLLGFSSFSLDIYQTTKIPFKLNYVGSDGKYAEALYDYWVVYPTFWGTTDSVEPEDFIKNGQPKISLETIIEKGWKKDITVEDHSQFIVVATTEQIESIKCEGIDAKFIYWGGYVDENNIVYNLYRSSSRIIPGTYTLDFK